MSGFLRSSVLCASIIACTHLPLFAGEEKEAREGGLTGTGIVGEIVELGSIVVNNQRITFTPDLPVASAAGGKSASELRPGETVAVAVERRGDLWVTDSIVQVHPVVGPVSKVDAEELIVMGASVRIGESNPDVTEGDWVAVSGFWNRGKVIATRIEVIAPQSQASVQGSFALPAKNGAFELGSVTLIGPEPEHAEEGNFLRAYGEPLKEGLQIQDMRVGLFDEPQALVLAEGYFSIVSSTGHYTVAGSGLSSYTEQRGDVMTQDRVRICGHKGNILKAEDNLNKAQIEQLKLLGCPLP